MILNKKFKYCDIYYDNEINTFICKLPQHVPSIMDNNYVNNKKSYCQNYPICLNSHGLSFDKQLKRFIKNIEFLLKIDILKDKIKKICLQIIIFLQKNNIHQKKNDIYNNTYVIQSNVNIKNNIIKNDDMLIILICKYKKQYIQCKIIIKKNKIYIIKIPNYNKFISFFNKKNLIVKETYEKIKINTNIKNINDVNSFPYLSKYLNNYNTKYFKTVKKKFGLCILCHKIKLIYSCEQLIKGLLMTIKMYEINKLNIKKDKLSEKYKKIIKIFNEFKYFAKRYIYVYIQQYADNNKYIKHDFYNHKKK